MLSFGIGRYQEKGKPVKELHEGDIIMCEPNIFHWYGAAPGTELSHLSIGTNANKAAVVWLQPVSDEEYNSQ